MKKIILSTLLLISPMISFADDGSGCGVGATLMKGKSGTVNHLFAWTIEYAVGVQTFALTSGTLGCDTSQPVGASLFIEENTEKLALDFSRGEGESLDALAEILNIDDTANFNQYVKSNFSSIYSVDASGEQVIISLIDLMKASEEYAPYVS